MKENKRTQVDSIKMECKVCRETTFRTCGKPRIAKRFAEHDFTQYSIVQCSSCGFYFILPEISLSQEQWSKIYEDNYFVTTEFSWRVALQAREVRERLNFIEQLKSFGAVNFLDMGCGEGYALKVALEKGWTAYGLDIADNLTSAVDRKEVSFFCGNLFDAEYPDNHFDVIYMDSVLEHIDYPLTTLKELQRILKPGGIFFTIVPNEDCLENKIKKCAYTLAGKKELYGVIKPFYPPYHIHGFNRKSIRAALQSSGFTVQSIDTFGSNYPFWRGFKMFTRPYFQALLLYPVGLCSCLLNNQIQLQVVSVNP